MKIVWDETRSDSFAIRATPDEYDAFPPVDALLTDRPPRDPDPERIALASYLAFGAWSSGDLELPHGVSPATAEAIEDDLRPVRIRPRPVVYAARALPRGSRAVDVGFALPAEPSTAPLLAVVPSIQARGVFETGDATIVPSNAFALDAAPELGAPCIRARLAVAVLFAAEVRAGALRLAGVVVDSAEAARLRALGRSVNLSFEFR